MCTNQNLYQKEVIMSRKKKLIFIVVAAVLTVLIILIAGISYFLGSQVVAGSTQLVTNESTANISDDFWTENGMDLDEFLGRYTIEKIEIISSFDGHIIPAEFISYGEKKQDTVIMVHGLGGNRHSNYPVAELFLANGFNVITYDQRSSNENTAEKTTFGYWEKYDLIDCIEYVKVNSDYNTIGVWGASFGGATAVQAVAYEDTQESVSFLLLDCPVSSMEWMIEEEMKNMDMGIPVSYMTWCGNVVNKLELGFSYKDADSTEAAKRILIPTLVMNSKVDKVTPYFMGKDIFDNINTDEKELWTVQDSPHCDLWSDYNDEYCNKVTNFMMRHSDFSQ